MILVFWNNGLPVLARNFFFISEPNGIKIILLHLYQKLFTVTGSQGVKSGCVKWFKYQISWHSEQNNKITSVPITFLAHILKRNHTHSNWWKSWIKGLLIYTLEAMILCLTLHWVKGGLSYFSLKVVVFRHLHFKAIFKGFPCNFC